MKQSLCRTDILAVVPLFDDDDDDVANGNVGFFTFRAKLSALHSVLGVLLFFYSYVWIRASAFLTHVCVLRFVFLFFYFFIIFHAFWRNTVTVYVLFIEQ